METVHYTHTWGIIWVWLFLLLFLLLPLLPVEEQTEEFVCDGCYGGPQEWSCPIHLEDRVYLDNVAVRYIHEQYFSFILHFSSICYQLSLTLYRRPGAVVHVYKCIKSNTSKSLWFYRVHDILTCHRHVFALAIRTKHWRGCGLRRWYTKAKPILLIQ